MDCWKGLNRITGNTQNSSLCACDSAGETNPFQNHAPKAPDKTRKGARMEGNALLLIMPFHPLQMPLNITFVATEKHHQWDGPASKDRRQSLTGTGPPLEANEGLFGAKSNLIANS